MKEVENVIKWLKILKSEVFFMKKATKLVFSVLMAGCLSLPAFAGCKPDQPSGKTEDYPTDGRVYNDFKVGGQVILGNNTQMSGYFRWPALGQSSANAADQDISRLTTGYSTMETDKAGSYVWNKTAVKEHQAQEIKHDDGSLTYKITITINEGLKFSDGSDVKAANYVAYTLAMSSPVSEASVQYNRAGYSLVGWESFHLYDGTNDGQHVEIKDEKGNVTDEGTASKAFSGLRLLSDYQFSLEVNSENYPYYFADTYGAVDCNHLGLVLGDGVEVKDDGKGVYLTDAWYAKKSDKYAKADHITAARTDTATYPYSGPYTIAKYDSANWEATLKINPQFKGNFEGQLPHVETVVYRKVVDETQFGQLAGGEIDVLTGLTGYAPVNNAILIAKSGNFKNVHYDRAGYGKVQFDCDFGPTMSEGVRQAFAYCLDREDFATTFCGGFGTVVHGPYSVNFQAYVDNQDKLEKELNSYAVSTAKAKQALEKDGWIYNEDGKTYSGSGVRYRKLTAKEAENEWFVNYKSVSNSNANYTDGKEYKTVKVGDDYYMPCVINWFSTYPNEVSDLLKTKYIKGTALWECGIGLTQTTGTFAVLLDQIYRRGTYTGTPTYGMFNLATGWNSCIYDYSYNWIDETDPLYKAYFGFSSNKLSDPYDADFKWSDAANKGLTYDQAMEKSGGKLGMNYLSFAMVYSVAPGDTAEYNKWFAAYMLRWNELIPDIPLYGNVYYDCYNAKILNFKTSPFFGAAKAILYCGVLDAQG